MPPKEQFDKETIIKTAMTLVEKEGVNSISARRISKELKCSTAPIYRVFKSMDDLEHEVVKEIGDLLIAYTEKEYTGHIFLDIGVGIITFAREYKRFYRILFMEGDKYLWALEKYYSETEKRMMTDWIAEHLSDEERKSILEKMCIFTHGVAALVCAGLIKESEASHEELIELLQETGGDIIGATIFKRNKDSCELFKDLPGVKHEKNHCNE